MKKFETVFRGYDKLQVQRFLDDVIKNYEVLLEKSKKQHIFPPMKRNVLESWRKDW